MCFLLIMPQKKVTNQMLIHRNSMTLEVILFSRSVDLEGLIIHVTQPPKIVGNLIMDSNRFAVKGVETVTAVFLAISLKL